MMSMRGLSIQQPWAAAIAFGTKRVENRSWAAPFWIIGKTVAIHASKRPDTAARPPEGESWPSVPMHLGAVVAVAEIASCHLSPDFGGTCGATRPPCSPWAVADQFHWVLASVRPLPAPVPCRGSLKLWRLPEDVETKVREQLEASHG